MHLRTTVPRAAPYSPLWRTSEIHESRGIAESGELRGHRILVATDGSGESRAASAIASILARRRGARPSAVRAFAHDAPPEFSALTATWESGDVQAMDVSRQLVRARLLRDVPDASSWPVHIVVGPAARGINSIADSTHAGLIVMGLRPSHELSTTTQVMQSVQVPVLATNGALADMPRCIVVGVDLSSSGLRAARASLSMLDDAGTLVLAFVRTGPAEEGMAHGIAKAFNRLRASLAAPRSVHVETVVLEGSVPCALAACATTIHADLIAVGSMQQHYMDRRGLGSTTTLLVHDAGRSLLVVPPGVTA